ncbi:MAG: quinoprotein dehydrogenase-associated putative ABC transporter substrate-binding protein [Gemmatimonadota bacterium]|nr:quinoprotein dehydrogenase-associated putative ABC transporter substrate-binding protein [Gemmatimonadota bacterium]MDH4348636.1 quinoprotein dehydrogenase-associated putative ABC transporter substrate-binding protein [Gemmatimonadota bacterium]MDH5284033.1 quinoprotein dehydrogenase-associated putative ABC transporter substrate-binding protein [Gemmatimonadota bacterium]
MEPGVLRVCADPDNMPFSNEAREGFENRLADLLAAAWSSELRYIWWAAPRGLFSRALNGSYCDVILQAPTEYDMAGVTRPYYRTGYVVVQRADAPHKVTSLDDPALKTMKIGVHLFASDAENSPPAMVLSAHGVVGNLVGFGTTFVGNKDRPEDIIQAVANGTVDLAMVWGPLAGYYARRVGADLTLTPIPDDTLTSTPMAFSMGIATRRRERAFRDSLQHFLDSRQADVAALLTEFGFPLFPIPPEPAGR